MIKSAFKIKIVQLNLTNKPKSVYYSRLDYFCLVQYQVHFSPRGVIAWLMIYEMNFAGKLAKI